MVRLSSSFIIRSQNESILQTPKALLIGSIMDQIQINVDGIITKVILIRELHEYTSLSFPILIT